APAAFSQTLSVSPTQFLPAALHDFDLALAQARVAAPSFAADLRSVIARADALDRQRRGRLFPMTPLLKGLAARDARTAAALLEPIVYPERFVMPASANA